MTSALAVSSNVNDRIWAKNAGALKDYPCDTIRLLLAALSKLSLSLEMFSSEATRTRTVLWIETARSLLRFALLQHNGFDVLLNGGGPDDVSVQVGPPVLSPMQMNLGPPEQQHEENPAPRVAVTDNAKDRLLWWKGSRSGQWCSAAQDHPSTLVSRRLLISWSPGLLVSWSCAPLHSCPVSLMYCQ